MLAPDSVHLAAMVANFIRLYPKYFSGPSVRSRLCMGVPKWGKFALYIDPDVKNQFKAAHEPANCVQGGCLYVCIFHILRHKIVYIKNGLLKRS